MHACKPIAFAQDESTFPVAAGIASAPEKFEYSITELAQEFGLTLRALRFYEIRGLLAPQRSGRKRIFSRADRDRLGAILKGKKLGFTLNEISQMIEAEAGRADEHSLKLSAEKCQEQIALFERQLKETAEALEELRRISRSFPQVKPTVVSSEPSQK